MTLRAQFAYLLMAQPQLKLWETRSVSTSHRGLIAIHVSGAFEKTDAMAASQFRMKYPETRDALGYDNRGFALKHIIGVAKLTECLKITPALIKTLTPRERDFGFWRVGHCAMRMEVVEVYDKPVFATGQLGVWNWTP